MPIPKSHCPTMYDVQSKYTRFTLVGSHEWLNRCLYLVHPIAVTRTIDDWHPIGSTRCYKTYRPTFYTNGRDLFGHAHNRMTASIGLSYSCHALLAAPYILCYFISLAYFAAGLYSFFFLSDKVNIFSCKCNLYDRFITQHLSYEANVTWQIVIISAIVLLTRSCPTHQIAATKQGSLPRSARVYRNALILGKSVERFGSVP